MQAYMPYFWIGVILCAAIVEAIGKKLIAVRFIPGAVLTSILAFVRCPVWAQILVYVGITALCWFLFIRLITPWMVARKSVGAEGMIGKSAKVIEQIDNLAGCGLVSVDGEQWAAKSVDSDLILDEGADVTVVAVEGVRVVCKEV